MKKRIISLLLVMLLVILSAAVVPTASAQTAASESKVEQYLASMSTEDKISMMIMPAFRWTTDEEGNRLNVTEITDDIADSLNRHSFAGVILFAQNTSTNEGATRLIDALQKENAAGGDRPQLLISIDQEGGNVTRLGQGTMTPGNMALGAINDTEVTKEVATMIASELNAIGINTDFAPDVDVNSNPANPVIGVRSFSDDPQIVAAHGSAFVEALNDMGVISTLKHFPGHGDTGTDTHTGYAETLKTWDQLRDCEMIPFRAGIAEGTDLVMTAHIAAPNVTGSGEPATMSYTILTEKLRGELGFEGLIITDALSMGAITKAYTSAEACVACIQAGIDILLMPSDYYEAFDGVVRAVETGEIPESRIDESVCRILAFKRRAGEE